MSELNKGWVLQAGREGYNVVHVQEKWVIGTLLRITAKQGKGRTGEEGLLTLCVITRVR